MLLYRQNDVLHAGGCLQVTDPAHHVLGLLAHHPIVGGQIRFALDAIDDQRIDVSFDWRAQLDMRRECGSAKPDDAGIADGMRISSGVAVARSHGVPSITSWVEAGNGSR